MTSLRRAHILYQGVKDQIGCHQEHSHDEGEGADHRSSILAIGTVSLSDPSSTTRTISAHCRVPIMVLAMYPPSL